MITLQEPYEPRPIRCLEIWGQAGWRMKMYGIRYGGDAPRPELVSTAKQIAMERLPSPAITTSRYGVGFIGVHDGRGANFIFVDWWANQNELYHHVYVGPAEQPSTLDYVTSKNSVTACIWDLAVMAHERDAWVRCVLNNPAGANIEAYLKTQLDAMV